MLTEKRKIDKIQKQLKEIKEFPYDYEKIWQLLPRDQPGVRIDVSFLNN